MMIDSNFKMENKNITMIKGDTLSFGVIICDENDKPFDQDLSSVTLTCKSNKSNDDIVFQKKLGDGVSKRGQGEYVVRVAPHDTENAEAGKYFYDLEIGANGDIFTIMHGILQIDDDIAKE